MSSTMYGSPTLFRINLAEFIFHATRYRTIANAGLLLRSALYATSRDCGGVDTCEQYKDVRSGNSQPAV